MIYCPNFKSINTLTKKINRKHELGIRISVYLMKPLLLRSAANKSSTVISRCSAQFAIFRCLLSTLASARYRKARTTTRVDNNSHNDANSLPVIVLNALSPYPTVVTDR